MQIRSIELPMQSGSTRRSVSATTKRHERARRGYAAAPVQGQPGSRTCHKTIASRANGFPCRRRRHRRLRGIPADGAHGRPLGCRARGSIVSPRCSQIQGVRRDLDKTVRVDVDRALGDVDADKLDAVFLPGSAVNADTMKPRVQAFPQVMQAARKTFAVSCHVLWELASA
jgi:hypothetical protein